MVLSERKKHILLAVVTDYIKTAQPVGSRTLARRYKIGLSPATIRNEMADLEELGFLIQPHTSAGRIPSQKGYRYYVDDLMEATDLKEEERAKISQAYEFEKLKEIEEIIKHTSNLLSLLTNYTALILGPQLKKSAFKKLQIMPVDQRRGLLVLVADTGFVKSKVINLPHTLSPGELNRIVSYLNMRLEGLTIDKITSKLIVELRRDLYHHIQFLEETFTLLEESLAEDERRVFLGGTTNILNQPEFGDIEKVKSLLSLFEQNSLLASLLSRPVAGVEGIVIKIGRENILEEVQECSLVMATYCLGKEVVGTIGVLGPTRMDYAKTVAVVEQVVSHLERL
ncbi:MAG TPA: heat-inducible transcription repressor HrcA [Firmicutes bacterium]|jgi:heat-inducible transcriptional repressor|nr:heat-inducible transcription repressor HrcA [Bacillota bacterium]